VAVDTGRIDFDFPLEPDLVRVVLAQSIIIKCGSLVDFASAAIQAAVGNMRSKFLSFIHALKLCFTRIIIF
jgi:hypothetical protein